MAGWLDWFVGSAESDPEPPAPSDLEPPIVADNVPADMAALLIELHEKTPDYHPPGK